MNLAVRKVYWNNDTQVKPATPLLFTAKVENIGEEVYVGTLMIEIRVDNKVVQTIAYKDGIAVGQTVEITGTEPWEAVKGEHVITAAIDAALAEPRVGRAGHARSACLRVNEEILVPPAPAAEKGYNTLTFSDDFETLDTIDNTGSGEEGYHWYVTRPWGESNLEPELDYSVKDSVMHLHNRDTRWNYGLCTIDTFRPVGYAFNKGYIEFRMRMKATADTGHVTGIRIPAIWSYSTATIWADALGRPQAPCVELDWMENWGNKYEDDYVTVTLHDHPYTDKDGKEHPHVVTNNGDLRGRNIGDNEWHVMAMQWNDDRLYTYLDGRVVSKVEFYEDNYPYPRPWNAEIGTFSYLGKQNMPIIIGGADDYPLEIDWIRVWSAGDETMLRQNVDE